MAEGGCLPWKVQKIDRSRGPAVNYKAIHAPLPKLPNGKSWLRDDKTGEWKVVDSSSSSGSGSNSNIPKGSHETSAEASKRTKEGDLMLEAASVDQSTSSKNEITTEQQQQQQQQLDYIEHTVLPSDTIQGLCLRYRVTATQLRQANRFSGNNLLLAPPKLVIPITTQHVSSYNIRLQDQNSDDYKIHAFLAEMPKLKTQEARAYLELYDYNLRLALEEAAADMAWEAQQQQKSRDAKPPKKSSISTPAAGISSTTAARGCRRGCLNECMMGGNRKSAAATNTIISDADGGSSNGCIQSLLSGNKNNNTLIITDEFEMASMLTTPLLEK